jgi:hypothetical protein
MAVGTIAALIALLAGSGILAGASSATNKSAKEQSKFKGLEEAKKVLKGTSLEGVYNDNELASLLERYRTTDDPSGIEKFFGGDPTRYTSGLEGFTADINKLNSFLGDESLFSGRPEMLNKNVIDLESENLFNTSKDNFLNQVNAGELSSLRDIQGTYDTYRKDMLQQQNLNRGQIMNAYQNTFRDQRTRAIEAGASAGLKLANNVNALLSAQNTQRATSLETSNQLANMAMQQQNAALNQRNISEQKRLDAADKYSDVNLGSFKDNRYLGQSQLRDVQNQDWMTGAQNRLSGLNLDSTLQNYATSKLGDSNFNPLNRKR